MSKFENLTKLKELHDTGVLNDEEYEAEKKKVLDSAEATETPQSPQQPVSQPQIVINNTNTNQNIAGLGIARQKNKWVSVLLCLFLGYFGGHKFYEGKIGMGILYLFTGGLFMIGVIIDLIVLLTKPNPYYV